MRPTVPRWRFTMPAEEGINPTVNRRVSGVGGGTKLPRLGPTGYRLATTAAAPWHPSWGGPAGRLVRRGGALGLS